jgi:hypothetical protein
MLFRLIGIEIVPLLRDNNPVYLENNVATGTDKDVGGALFNCEFQPLKHHNGCHSFPA